MRLPCAPRCYLLVMVSGEASGCANKSHGQPLFEPFLLHLYHKIMPKTLQNLGSPSLSGLAVAEESVARTQRLLSEIEALRGVSPLAAKRITLVGASKGQAWDAIAKAVEGGLMAIGENKVQEAEAKFESVPAARVPQLHLIGALQSNKAADAVARFDVIHTLDRPKLADALAREMAAQEKSLPCFVQVNLGEEAQKAGVAVAALGGLLAVAKHAGLQVVGLMAVPPQDAPAAPYFALLRKLADEHGLEKLSMGMSNDWREAVRLGATHVRIGTALFGERR